MRINYLAVIVAAIVYWLLGAMWYSPLLFANRWVELMGKTMEQMKQGSHSPMPYIVALLCNLVLAFVLALVCNASGATTMGKGASTGILMWLGFVGTITLTTYQFDGRPVALWAINYGYSLVGMILMGAILGAWRKKTT